jgi:hypothetical protein
MQSSVPPYFFNLVSRFCDAHFDVASVLERAIQRSQQPVPVLNGPVQELPATE